MRYLHRLFLTALLLVTGASLAAAFEVGAYFDLSNLDFSRNRPSTATTLPGDTYVWGVALNGRQQLSDELTLDLSLSSDPVLRNVGYSLLTYRDRFFSLRLGPYFGILNSPSTILQSGLSTTVEVYVPGLTFLGLRSDNSLSARLVVPGDYIQEESELSIGFFLPNVIPTIYVQSKRFTWKTDAGEAVDALTAYGLEADIFEKNIPYRIVLDLAYHDVSRSFLEATETTHSYGALVLGSELSAELFERVSLLVDLESSIYMFGRDALLGSVKADEFLFRLRTGISYEL
jgi:hypothetical protein